MKSIKFRLKNQLLSLADQFEQMKPEVTQTAVKCGANQTQAKEENLPKTEMRHETKLPVRRTHPHTHKSVRLFRGENQNRKLDGRDQLRRSESSRLYLR